MKPLIITLLASLVLFLPAHKTPVEGGAVNTKNYAPKLLKPLSEPNLKPQAQLDSIAVAPAVSAPAPVSSVSCGDPHAIMAAAGVSEAYFGAVDYIISHEGTWCGATRYNTAGSGAYGICQALPGGKMASAGADWATNPVTQLRWCDSYANSRYRGWWNAYNYWLANHLW